MVRDSGAELNGGGGELRGSERQILLQALRYSGESEKDGGWPSVDERCWERIFHAAAQLGVAPVLYARLKTPALPAVVPGSILQRHKGDLIWSQAQNMKVFARLRAVLEVLRANRIDVMALKGAALAELVYGQIGLRTMGDIDLLVRRSELAKVRGILEDMG